MSCQPDFWHLVGNGKKPHARRPPIARKDSRHDIIEGSRDDRVKLPGSDQAWHLPCFCPKCSAVGRFIPNLFGNRMETVK